MVAPGLRRRHNGCTSRGTSNRVPEYAVQDYIYAVRLGLAFSLLGVVLLLVL